MCASSSPAVKHCSSSKSRRQEGRTSDKLPSKQSSHSSSSSHVLEEVERTTVHPILRAIETMQTECDRPFGRILDAGTGLGSFHWLAHLLSHQDDFHVDADHWVAVTASPVMYKAVTKEAQRIGIDHPENHLILGNWFQQEQGQEPLLQGEMFDTILIDYLIGAMDAFSPYQQDCILERLVEHLNPGGRVFLIGTEPIPDRDETNAEKNLVCRVYKMRDACILLAGDRCYREYPLSWTLRQMNRCGLTVIRNTNQQYHLLHQKEDLHDQIGVGRSMLKKIPDQSLANAMQEALGSLEVEARRMLMNKSNHEGIPLGFDYLVVAEMPYKE